MKRQLVEWENIFANHTLSKELLSRIHKELLQLNHNKTSKNSILNGQGNWTDISPRRQNGHLKKKKRKITNVDRDVEKVEPACTVGRTVKCYCCYGKHYGGSAKKLKLELSTTISLLGVYPKELKAESWNDIYTSVFTAALFTIAKMWKQLNVHEWMNG